MFASKRVLELGKGCMFVEYCFALIKIVRASSLEHVNNFVWALCSCTDVQWRAHLGIRLSNSLVTPGSWQRFLPIVRSVGLRTEALAKPQPSRAGAMVGLRSVLILRWCHWVRVCGHHARGRLEWAPSRTLLLFSPRRPVTKDQSHSCILLRPALLQPTSLGLHYVRIRLEFFLFGIWKLKEHI